MTTIDTHVSQPPRPPRALALACVAEWVTTTDHKRIGRLYLGAAALCVHRRRPSWQCCSASSASRPRASAARRFAHAAVLALAVRFHLPGAAAAHRRSSPSRSCRCRWALARSPSPVWPRQASGPGSSAPVWPSSRSSTTAVPMVATPRFVDLFTLSTVLVPLGLLASVVSLATTILTTRAPGMNMRRVPFFTWSVLVASLGAGRRAAGAGRRPAVRVRRSPLPVAQRAQRQPCARRVGRLRLHASPPPLLFAIPALGFLADTVATATGAAPARRAASSSPASAWSASAVFGTVLQQPATLRAGFLDLSFGDKLTDLLPFALVHVLPLLGAFIARGARAPRASPPKPKVTAPLVFGLFAALLAARRHRRQRARPHR